MIMIIRSNNNNKELNLLEQPPSADDAVAAWRTYIYIYIYIERERER